LDDIDSEDAAKLKQVSRLNAAMAYLKIKQYSKAIESASEVLKKDPNNPKALFRRGVAYIETQSYDKAKTDLELLSKNEPENG
jgi:tetratricopeptide (TPR) repeat protein